MLYCQNSQFTATIELTGQVVLFKTSVIILKLRGDLQDCL